MMPVNFSFPGTGWLSGSCARIYALFMWHLLKR